MEGRREAAKQLYAEAHESTGDAWAWARDAAEAGVALARLIQADQPYNKRIKPVLQCSAELCPDVAAEPLARYLNSHHDWSAAKMLVGGGTDGFNGETLYLLGACLKREEPETARSLLRAAMHKFTPSAAVELIDMSLCDKLKLTATLDEIMAIGKEFAESVEYLAKESGNSALARYVQQRIAEIKGVCH